MSEYQAVYDAVRSRISNGDIGHAVSQAMRDANLSHYAERAMNSAQEAAGEWSRPSVLMRPALSNDGNMWCALYGENLQDGVAGFGESPYRAMADFDRNWATKLPARPGVQPPTAPITFDPERPF